MDDFNLNLLDWGSSNVLAIALGNTVWPWDASNFTYSKFMTIDDEDGLVTSVNWAPDDHQITIGLNNFHVQLWILLLRDSGGSGNLFHIWDWSLASSNAQSQWLHKLEDHTAPVRALAWCPFPSNLLVSSGSWGDECIKSWDTSTGACKSSIDTRSELTLWKYPSMKKLVKLNGHSSSVLYMAQSPNGCTVAFVVGDELLVLWNLFGTSWVWKSAAESFALASCI
ncbi:hypothetical protein FH972_015183 [Carpinus fangiana]|uniref:Anaphase-promoting complex subunit 4 WD40 domain-containing protein n=1 Tax=Carpinus fangiana TaxID=176857 RepID=A0A5N6RFF3_9ROSI|nr:hypothetical protein FH972_015183 [Carpinus fangiana]